MQTLLNLIDYLEFIEQIVNAVLWKCHPCHLLTFVMTFSVFSYYFVSFHSNSFEFKVFPNFCAIQIKKEFKLAQIKIQIIFRSFWMLHQSLARFEKLLANKDSKFNANSRVYIEKSFQTCDAHNLIIKNQCTNHHLVITQTPGLVRNEKDLSN